MSYSLIAMATGARKRSAQGYGGLGFQSQPLTHVCHVMVKNARGAWIVDKVLTNATAEEEHAAMEACVHKWNRASRRNTVACVWLSARNDDMAKREVEAEDKNHECDADYRD